LAHPPITTQTTAAMAAVLRPRRSPVDWGYLAVADDCIRAIGPEEETPIARVRSGGGRESRMMKEPCQLPGSNSQPSTQPVCCDLLHLGSWIRELGVGTGRCFSNLLGFLRVCRGIRSPACRGTSPR
jgi:hypothetical protein